MNASQAKKIALYDLLSQLGYTPADTKKSGNEIWYCSPFRTETEPSFKIKLDQNVWYDFGEGAGGNILDFVMKYKSCGFNEALSFLSDRSLKPSTYSVNANNKINQPALDIFNEKAPLINEIKPLYHFALKDYVRGRGVSLPIALKYLKEINYTVDEKNYFALGFENISNGWELRNQFFKGCIGNKDISLIKTGSEDLVAFEGFMDFLSYLTFKGINEVRSDVLILNSTSMKGRAIELVKKNGYKNIETFFDNDKGGLSAHELFCKELNDTAIIPRNNLYIPYKDFNEFLNKNSQKQLALNT